VGLEDFFAGGHPVLCPGDIVFMLLTVVVLIVLIADIKRGVGEDKVGEGFPGFAKDVYAIAVYYPID
jgi:hypothetical protein